MMWMLSMLFCVGVFALVAYVGYRYAVTVFVLTSIGMLCDALGLVP